MYVCIYVYVSGYIYIYIYIHSLPDFYIVSWLFGLYLYFYVHNIPDPDHLYRHTAARTIIIDVFIIRSSINHSMNMSNVLSFYRVNVGTKGKTA